MYVMERNVSVGGKGGGRRGRGRGGGGGEGGGGEGTEGGDRKRQPELETVCLPVLRAKKGSTKGCLILRDPRLFILFLPPKLSLKNLVDNLGTKRWSDKHK